MNKINDLGRELHKPIKKKFQKRKVVVFRVDEIWSCDLVDMQEWNKENDNYKYLLNIVDVFSKYAWSIPIVNKTGQTVTNAFSDIFINDKRKPEKIWVDQGMEFYNKIFIKLLKDNNISIYSSFGDSKSCVVERFNRTLKNWMWLYFDSNNTRRYVEYLPEIMTYYNNKKHRTIKMSPNDAIMKNNYSAVYKILNKKNEPSFIQSFNTGDYVRISRIKGDFEKGYIANWSREIYIIEQVILTNPVTYKIKDLYNEIIEGNFYNEELQKTTKPSEFLIEKILKSKKVNGKIMYYVKWLGYSKKHNSWINKKDVK